MVPCAVQIDGHAVRGVPLAILNTITIRSALGRPPRLIVVNFDGPISAHLGYHSSVVLVVLAVPCAVCLSNGAGQLHEGMSGGAEWAGVGP